MPRWWCHFFADDDAADDTNTADNYAGSTDYKIYPYSLRNRNHSPNADDDDASSPDDAAPLDSIIDSKLKREIDPRAMIKLKNI